MRMTPPWRPSPISARSWAQFVRASFAYCQRSARYDKVLAGERVNIFDPALGGGAL